MPTGSNTAGPEEIRNILPHRPPFLFLDRVEAIAPPDTARGIWRVDPRTSFLAGHFPGRPIVPGLLLVEAMAQAAGVLIGVASDGAAAPGFHYLASVENSRFKRSVHPEQVVSLEVARRRGSAGGRLWQFIAEARVDEESVAEAAFTVLRAPGE